jgi:hypothetical protein
MKKLILPLLLLACCGYALAQVAVERVPLGSGTPGAAGVENATPWDLDIYHAPQYMPGYPTAASIFPRAVSVFCVEKEKGIQCKGYHWSREMGRAEYLMIRPVMVKEFPAEP